MNKKLNIIILVLAFFLLFAFGCKKEEDNKEEEEKKPELSTNLNEYKLVEGDSSSLFYNIINKKEDTVLVVEVEDENIARVEDDIIYALKKGDTTITLYLNSNPDNKIVISVSVSEKVVDKPTLKITNKISLLALFEDYNLTYDISDKSSVIWSVSDNEIASITSKGTLTGLKEGKVIVTVTSKNFSDVKDEMEVEFVFDVWKFMDSIQNENVLVQDVTAYGATEQKVKVLGSVSQYYFGDIEIIEAYGPINNNEYTGTVATQDIMKLDEKGYTRPGIYLEELQYITYHDTANIAENADAKMHNTYMYSEGNRTARARSWHYTVDDTYIYHNVPDNEVTWQGDSYDAYAKSIGIETCVNVGSDFYRTWQRMGKLVASLLYEYGLSSDAVKQHYNWNQKDCPKTLRNNGLWDTAYDMIKVELSVLELMEGYDIEFKSFSPKYLDDTGKVIYQGKDDVRLAYQITLTKDGVSSSKMYHANLEGTNSTSIYAPSMVALAAADFFDALVVNANLDYDNINALLTAYMSLSDEAKACVATYDYLKEAEEKYLATYAVDSNIVVNKVYVYDGTASASKVYSYIELKNISKQKVSGNIKINISGAKSMEIDLGELSLSAGQTYLIAFGNTIYNGGDYYDFIVPNKVVNDDLPLSNFTITVLNDDNILDKLGLDEASDKEENAAVFEDNAYSIVRKQAIDTNDNKRDFGASLSIEPSGATFVADAIFEFDYKVKAMDRTITLEDEDALNQLLNEYNEFDEEEKKQVSTKMLLDELIIEVEGIKNPNLAVVKKAILKIPAQIVDDFEFPKVDGLTFTYKDPSQESIFDIENGEYAEVIHEYTPVTLIASYNDYSEEFTVNFGICHENDNIIYVSGTTVPSKGLTNEGFATYEDQLGAVGFGGVAVRIEGKVFFIGKNCLIDIDDSNGTQLSRATLRPYGKSDAADINNNGFVNGAPAEYKGTGVLYHNVSNETLTLDLTDTYGRANAGSYGYAKVFFSLNDNGEYVVTQIYQHTGENFSTDGNIVEFKPGEYIWCPHTFETNASYGTWFMFPGPSAAGGMLEEGVVAEFIHYKNEAKD